jgi:hypothetical protein
MRAGGGPHRRRGSTDQLHREGNGCRGALNGLRASAGGGGSSLARWSEARRPGVEEIEGEEGGGVRRPLEWQAASCSTHGEGEGSGSWAAARCVREGRVSSGTTRARRAWVAADEQRRARQVVGWRRGKRGRERGGWWVGWPGCGAQL